MRALAWGILAGLTGCGGDVLTDGQNMAVHGERTGVFERLDRAICTIGTSVPQDALEVTMFFKDDKDDDVLALGSRVPFTEWPELHVEERKLVQGNGLLVLSPDVEASEIYRLALDGQTGAPVPARFEFSVGERVPFLIGGEPAAVGKVEVFIPIYRIAEGATYPDVLTQEPRPISGHVEDMRLYCDDAL